MKYLPRQSNFSFSIYAWKRRVMLFVAINLISFIFLPSLFYGFWDTVGSITKNMAHSRKVYFIKRNKGRTWADLYLMKENWTGAFKAMNPKEWMR